MNEAVKHMVLLSAQRAGKTEAMRQAAAARSRWDLGRDFIAKARERMRTRAALAALGKAQT